MTTIILLALALSMDAFAASVSQGTAARPSATLAGALRVGAAFGSAQAIMPLLGWALGLTFASVIRDVDHWIAFVLLAAIGGRMMHSGLTTGLDVEDDPIPLLTGWALAGVAVATSIDAAAAEGDYATRDNSSFARSALIRCTTETPMPHSATLRAAAVGLVSSARRRPRP